MKNILFLLNGYGIGGTEKTAYIYMKTLKNDFNVFSASISGGGPRFEDFLSLGKAFILKGDFDKLKFLVKENNINILYLHMISQHKNSQDLIDFLKWAKLLNIKIIETSPFSIYTPDTDCFIDNKLFVSKGSLLKFMRKFNINNKGKYNFLYNPIDIQDLKKYIISEQKRQELRKFLGINLQDFVIGKVGRADLWKRDDTIIKIIPYLIRRIPNIKIVVRAVPQLKIRQINRCGYSKYFVFLPETVKEKDICETYQIMDVMVHTSFIGESFGIALVEGMFFQLPVFSIDTNRMERTLFDRDNSQGEILGEHNINFIDNNYKSLSDKIYKLYQNKDLLRNVGKNNMVWAINNYSSEILKKRLLNIINNDSDDFDFNLEMDKYTKRSRHSTIFYRIYLSYLAVIRKLYMIIKTIGNRIFSKQCAKNRVGYSKNDL